MSLPQRINRKSDKADAGRREKTCPVCLRNFVRDTKKYSHQQWAEKVFCSNACANTKPMAERLVSGSIVCPESACWNWQTALDKDGYGRIVVTRNRKRQYLRAHRAAFLEWVGPLSTGQVVMHACDNPSCINPNHLSSGTQRSNNDDKMAKGRGANQFGPYRGGGNATSS